MSSAYAWRIDQDHLDGSTVGVRGPSDARTADDGTPIGYEHQHLFEMYDDDGIHYVTGTLYWTGAAEPEESYAYAPLRDYGAGGMGCVTVRYPGRPDWDCG